MERIDWNPFRQIKDGKELAYLLLLRPYITFTPNEQGVLEAYEFSPDGKTFKARIAPTARWRDGSPVTPLEAAAGIAEGFRHRPIGERVKVIGAEQGPKKGWSSVSGIHVIDDRTFEITFASEIENLTGVVREALGSTSRHNRVWPVRRSGEVLLKYESVSNSLIRVAGRSIAIVPASRCTGADFSVYPEPVGKAVSSFEVRPLPTAQAITLQPNTERLDLRTRSALGAWVRAAFHALPKSSGVEVTDNFFLPTEPGYLDSTPWTMKGDLELLKRRTFRIGVESPVHRTALAAAAANDRISVEIIDLPLKDSVVDAQVLSSGIHDGRQIILQDILKWNFVSDLLRDAPKTRRSLETIAQRSASTIPPDNETLQGFVSAASAEQSLIPIGRRHVPAVSRPGLPVYLDWDDQGSPVFRQRSGTRVK